MICAGCGATNETLAARGDRISAVELVVSVEDKVTLKRKIAYCSNCLAIDIPAAIIDDLDYEPSYDENGEGPWVITDGPVTYLEEDEWKLVRSDPTSSGGMLIELMPREEPRTICEFCEEIAFFQGTVRNEETHEDEVVRVCGDHTGKLHEGTVKELVEVSA